ncbi:MAG TPA: hypothetical protein VGC62_11555 [Pseudomonas sp.]|uniref:hypothetical protein n=1 Tax=Pseudomonas sp. TaxID=306 RepID=UPI002ED7BFDD
MKIDDMPSKTLEAGNKVWTEILGYNVDCQQPEYSDGTGWGLGEVVSVGGEYGGEYLYRANEQ